jgi:hypothetical protein
MRALRDGIPRALKLHDTAEGALYGRYCRALVRRFGKLPADALVTLRDAGLIVVELERLAQDLEVARARKRRRDQVRIRRQMVILRTQRLTLERHLAERMNGRRRRPAGPLTAEDLE